MLTINHRTEARPNPYKHYPVLKKAGKQIEDAMKEFVFILYFFFQSTIMSNPGQVVHTSYLEKVGDDSDDVNGKHNNNNNNVMRSY